MRPSAPEWRAFPPSPTESFDPGIGGGPVEGGQPPGGGLAPRGGLILRRPALLAVAGAAALVTLGLLVLVAAVWLGPAGSGSGLTLAGEPLDSGGVAAAERSEGDGQAQAPAEASTIVIDVAGAVMRPGLQRMRQGDRVGDAIAAAGGFGPAADLAVVAEQLNLAQVLADGQKVLVPARGSITSAEVRPTGPAASRPPSGGTRLDLNRASTSELETLPGIGPVTADRIVEAREAAPFTSVQELRDRGVVGEAVLGRIRDLVTAAP